MKILNLRVSFLLLFFTGLNFIGYSQFKSNIQLIINDVIYRDGNLTVKYQIDNAKLNDNIRVWIFVFNSKKDTLQAKTWRGDVNKFMEGGGEKVAVWDIFNDGLELRDSITVKVLATVENRFYLDNPLILSTIYPGWGDYQIRPQKPYWIYGAIGYSLVGASIGTYLSSIDNYDNYKGHNSVDENNSYLNKANLNKNLTYAFIGAAGIVWALDYIGILKRKKEIKKSWKKSPPLRENPNIPGFKITSAISQKTFVNTSLTFLQMVEGAVRYIDVDENKCLDAFEKGFIEFQIINYGPAKAVDFYAKIKPLNSSEKIYFSDSIKIGTIAVNQTKTIRLPIKASSDINTGILNIEILVYSYLNNPVAPFSIAIKTCQFEYKKEISAAELTSDIDKDLPLLPLTGKEKFALIIGNEGYANENTGLSQNFNIPYARHDALTFKKYAVNILGVKESNIIFLLDASKKEMREGILNIADKVKKVRDGAELIFYYAGHGLADTSTLAPYLIPVDIAPENLTEGISLDFLYKNFWESRSTKSMVIMDASFNNGGRNIGLRGPSANKLNPRREVISGNTVIFNAVSENYTANVYPEMKHGLFTYCFLNKIKETKGNINFRALDNYLKTYVSEKALSINTQQMPIALVSIAVSDIWQNWSIR